MLKQRAAQLRSVLLRRTGAHRAYLALRPPRYPGLKLTARRFLNYYLVKVQRARGNIKVLGFPISLTFEATNVCNLNCPYCFTGDGEVGRKRTMMPMDMYQRLIDELGDHALLIDFYNWGEPLLNKNIYEMIRLASDKGLSTIISSNFSVPFDSERAEKLVASGLAAIGAGIDGARQQSLEQYRVGANFDLVMENIRLLVEAKRKLKSTTPDICWSFHVFEHNQHEVDEARAAAAELGISFFASKGWVAGDEWESGSEITFPPNSNPSAERCKYLWEYAIVNNDGGVAPCAAAFYREDDYDSIVDKSFKEVWNNQQFQDARWLFRSRANAPQHAKDLICHDCPYTVVWENYQQHVAQGNSKDSFQPGSTTNDWFNYFFERRPTKKTGGGDVIGLQQVRAASEDGGGKAETHGRTAHV